MPQSTKEKLGLLALEPRVLLDAAGFVTGAEVAMEALVFEDAQIGVEAIFNPDQKSSETSSNALLTALAESEDDSSASSGATFTIDGGFTPPVVVPVDTDNEDYTVTIDTGFTSPVVVPGDTASEDHLVTFESALPSSDNSDDSGDIPTLNGPTLYSGTGDVLAVGVLDSEMSAPVNEPSEEQSVTIDDAGTPPVLIPAEQPNEDYTVTIDTGFTPPVVVPGDTASEDHLVTFESALPSSDLSLIHI